MTTEQPIIERLSNGAAVMLRARAGKPKGGARARHSRFMPKGLSLALASAFSAAGTSISQTLAGLSITLAGLSQAQAQSQAAVLPQGGVAVHGGATIQQSGKTLNVNTTNGAGNKSIINWQSFNIGAGHTTNINQPNAQSSSLNRVVTNAPSQIYGTLRSNGQVILVNQNGIAVGSGGVVDTAGFTASTLNISDADYKAGRLRFEGHALSGGVQVDGVIRSSNGDVVLFAPQIATGKDAVVKADNGNVIVGAGQSVEVTGRGLEGVRFVIQGADNKAINLGTLQGNAVGVFAGTLRHSGVIQAQQATMEGGRVVLRAVKDVEISKDAQSVSPAGPRIQADGGLNAAGAAQAGGSVRIEAAQGDVRIGAGSQISANAAHAPVSSSNQAPALANAAGGAIDIVAVQGRVITEAGSVISATGSPGGTIRIVGAQGASVASVLNASSPSRGAVEQAGSLVLITTQDVGGRIEVLSPADVSLQPGAELLVSGDAGGGTILVGGDYQGANAAIVNAQNTNVSAGVLLEANARSLGDGGKVIVWADNDTHFSGTLHAKGGEQGGDGGFGETSGKKHLYYRGRADLGARRGRVGTLLLDPTYITIQGGTADGSDLLDLSSNQLLDDISGGNAGTITSSNVLPVFTIYESEIENTDANIVLIASNKISTSGTFTDNDLALASGRSLSLMVTNAGSGEGIDLSGVHVKTSGGGSITLTANSSSSNGAITLGQISTNGGTLAATADGLITLKALVNTVSGNVNLNSSAFGITFSNIGTNGAIHAGTGQVSLNASDGVSMASATSISGSQVVFNTNYLTLNTSSASVTGTDLVWIAPPTAVNVSLGGTQDDVNTGTLTNSTLGLTSGELARINTPLLKIGGTNNAFTLNGNVAWGSNALEITGSSIGQAVSTYAITAGALGLWGVGGVALTGSNTVASLAGKFTSGNFLFTNSAGFSVDTAGILQGIKGGTSGSQVSLFAGGASTAITLNKGIDTDGAHIVLNAPYVRIGAPTITLDSGGTLGNAGSIQFGELTFSGDTPNVTGGTIFAANPGYGLTLSAAGSFAGANGGTITLPNEIGNHGGAGSYLQKLTMNAGAGSGGAQGTVRVVGNILLDANGAGAANAGTLTVNNANLRIHSDAAINTNASTAASSHGGSILLGSDAPIHGTSDHAHLMLKADGGINGDGGEIDLGAVGTFGTSITIGAGHLRQLTVSALGAGAGNTGIVKLGADVRTHAGLSDGDISIQGHVVVANSSVTLSSSSWNDTNAGDIRLGTVGSVSGLAIGNALRLDATPATPTVGSSVGNIHLGDIGATGGWYLRYLTVENEAPDAGVGTLYLGGNIQLDRGLGLNDESSLSIRTGQLILTKSIVMDTLLSTAGEAGDVRIQAHAISAPASTAYSLSVNTSTPDNIRQGGAIELEAIANNSGGSALASISLQSTSTGAGLNGVITLHDDLRVASNGSVQVHGDVVLESDVLIGAETGAQNVSVTMTGILNDSTVGSNMLTLDSGTLSSGGVINLAGLQVGGTNRIRALSLSAGSAQIGVVRTTEGISAETYGSLQVAGSLHSQGGDISLSAGNALVSNATLSLQANISSVGGDGSGSPGEDGGAISVYVGGNDNTLSIANGVQILSQGGDAGLASGTGYAGGSAGAISLETAGYLNLSSNVSLVSRGGHGSAGQAGLGFGDPGSAGGAGGHGGMISISLNSGGGDTLNLPTGLYIQSKGGDGGAGGQGAMGATGDDANNISLASAGGTGGAGGAGGHGGAGGSLNIFAPTLTISGAMLLSQGGVGGAGGNGGQGGKGGGGFTDGTISNGPGNGGAGGHGGNAGSAGDTNGIYLESSGTGTLSLANSQVTALIGTGGALGMGGLGGAPGDVNGTGMPATSGTNGNQGTLATVVGSGVTVESSNGGISLTNSSVNGYKVAMLADDGDLLMNAASSLGSTQTYEVFVDAYGVAQLAGLTGKYIKVRADRAESAAGYAGTHVSGQYIHFGDGNVGVQTDVGSSLAPIKVGSYLGADPELRANATSEVWLSGNGNMTIGGIVTWVDSPDSGTINISTSGILTTTALSLGEGGNAGIVNSGTGDVGIRLSGDSGVVVSANTNLTGNSAWRGIQATGSGGVSIQSANGDVLVNANVSANDSGAVQIQAMGTGWTLSVGAGSNLFASAGFVSLRGASLDVQGSVTSGATSVSAPGVVLISDKLSLASGTISSPDAPVAILAKTNSYDIHVVSTLASPANTLEVEVDSLIGIDTSSLQLGNANLSGGQLVFKTSYDASLASLPANLVLYGSSISQDAGALLKLDQLMAKAVNGVDLANGNASNFVAGGVTGLGDFVFHTGSGTVTVGTVAGVAGVGTANGRIELKGHNGLLIAADLNAGMGNDNSSVDLLVGSTGATVSVANSVTVSGKDTGGVAIYVQADDLSNLGTLNASGSAIGFNPFTAGKNLVFGGAGDFSLTASELAGFSNYTGLYFGHTLGGNAFDSIDLQTAVNLGSAHLYLRSDQDINQLNTGAITAGTLEAISTSGVYLDAAVNEIGALKATATAASGSILFKNHGNFNLASNIVAGAGTGGVSLASLSGSIRNPSDHTISGGSAGMLLTAGDDLGSAANVLRVSSSGQVALSAGAASADTGDIYLLSVSDLNVGVVAATQLASQVNIATASSKHITINGSFATADDQVHINAGGSLAFASGTIRGSQVTIEAQGGAITGGTASLDIDAVGGATVKAQADIGSLVNPVSVKAGAFTLGNANGGAAQDKMFVELTPNGMSQLTTSQINVDVSTLTDLFVKAGTGVSDIWINNDASESNPIHATLSIPTGSISVTQPNAVFSGAGSFTLDASSTVLQTSTTIQNTVHVTGASTIASGTGVLKGTGTWANAGQTLTVEGELRPGDTSVANAIGSLTVSGGVSMVGGSKLLIEAASTSSYDKLIVGGSFSANASATVSVAESTTFMSVGDQFDVVSYAAGGPSVLPQVQSTNADLGLTASTTAPSGGMLRLSVDSVINRWLDASVSQNWSDGSNWSRTHAPTTSEDAVINPIDVGRAVTLSSGAQAARSLSVAGDDSLRITGGSLNLTSLSSFGSGSTLAVTGGTLSGAANVQLDGVFNWSGGTIGGAGVLITSAGSQSEISGDVTAQRSWSHNGDLSLTGASRLNLDAATLSNFSGASISVSSSMGTPIQLSNSAQFDNQGTLNWNTNASSKIEGSGIFRNQSGGVVNINGTSTLRLGTSGVAVDAGTYNTFAGSRLEQFAGTRTIAPGFAFVGPGIFEISAGSVGIAPSNTLNIAAGSTLTMTGGVLGSLGDLQVDGVLNFSGGSIAGGGKIETSSGAVANITGSAFHSRPWFNHGTINLTGPVGYLVVASNLTNETGGVINVNSTYNSTTFYLALASSEFTNEGTIYWNSGSGSSNSAIGGTAGSSFYNSGQFNVDGNSSMSVQIGGADTGTYSVASGSTLKLSSGNRSLAAGSNVDGAGRLVNSGAAITANGAFDIASTGTLELTGGSLILNTSSAPNFSNPLLVTGGTLTLNTPDVVFDVPVTVSGATLNGAADFDFAAGSSLSLQNATIDGAGTLGSGAGINTVVTSASSIGRNWTNSGTIAMAGAGSYLTLDSNLNNLGSGVLNMGSSYDGPVIYLNSATGQFNNAGAINWNSGPAATTSSVGGTAGSSFSHSGQFNVTGNSTVSVSVPNFNQSGTIDIAAGSTFKRSIGLANAGLLRGGGTLDVVGASSLSSVGGTIAPGGTGQVATLSVAGNADLTGASLLFDIDSAASYDRLLISGNVNTGGAPLVLSELSGNYTVGNSWSLLSFGGSLSGGASANSSAISGATFAVTTTSSSGGAIVATAASVLNRWSETASTDDWHTAGNWSRGHMPNASEDVLINVSAADQQVTISSSNAMAKTITINGDDDLSIAGRTLTVGNAFASSIASGATLSLNNGAFAQVGGGGTLDLAGTLNADGTAIIHLDSLNNSGAIKVNSGTLSLMGGGSDTSGAYTVNAGARLSLLSGQRTFGTTTSLSGNGTLGIDGAKLTVSQISASLPLFADGTVDVASGQFHVAGVPAVIHNLKLAPSGTLSTAGSGDHLMVVDTFDSTGGKITGPGTLNTNPGSSTTVQGVLTLDGTVWENSAGVTFKAASQFDAIALANGSVFSNIAGGSVIGKNLQQFMVFEGATLGVGSAVHNEGYMEFNPQSPSQTVFMDVATFTNSSTGTVRVGGGANFVLTPSVFNQQGTLTIADHSTFGVTTLNNSGLIEGVGTINLGGGTLTHTGSLRPGDVDGSSGLGTLTVQGNLQLGNMSFVSFDLDPLGSDKVAVSGDIVLVGVNGPQFTFAELNPLSFTGLEASQTVMTAGGGFTGSVSQYQWSNSSSDIDFAANAEFANKRLTASVTGIDNYWWNPTPAGGSWFTASNWSRNAVPNQLHDVTIDAAGANKVTITSGNAFARSIVIGETNADQTLYINGKSLTVNDPNAVGGLRVDLYGASTLDIVGGGTLALGGGYSNFQPGAVVKGVGFTLSAYSGSLGDTTIYNYGKIINTGGSSTLGQGSGARTVAFENSSSGTIDTGAGGGSITISAASFGQNGLMITRSNRISVTGGDFANSANGRVLLAGGTLDAGANNIVNYGKIDGTGTLTANIVENLGTLAPGSIASAGSLLINGAFTNEVSGTLSVRAFTPVSHDFLQVTGPVDLNGTLDLVASGTHAFAGGQSYQVIQSTNTPVGGFATVSGIGILNFSQSSSGAGQTVSLANPAASIVWVGGDGDWDVASNWDLNRLPQSGDTVIINPTGAKTIVVDSGTDLSGLSFSASIGDDTILIASGGSLHIPGGSTLNGLLHVNNGGSLTSSGTNVARQVSMSGGSFVNNGHFTTDTLQLSGGTVSIAGGQTLNVASAGSWSGGAIQGAGTIGIAGGITFALSGVGNRALDGVQLYNQGTLAMGLSSGGALEINNGAVLINGAGGHIATSGSAQQITTSSGTGSLVVNGGHVEAAASAGLIIAPTSLSVVGGSSFNANELIQLKASDASYSGVIDFHGFMFMGAGNHTLSTGTQLQGTGLVSISDALANVSVSEDASLAGTFSLSLDQGSLNIGSGKTLTVGGSSNLYLGQSVGGAGGVIRNQANVLANAPGTQTMTPDFVNQGTLSVDGHAIFTGGLTLNAAGTVDLAGGAILERSAGIANHGLITTQGDATLNVGAGGYSGTGTLRPGAGAPSATLSIAGNADFTSSSIEIGLASLSNYDRIAVSGNATVSASMAVTVSEVGSAFVGSGDSFAIVTAGGTLSGAIGSVYTTDSDVSYGASSSLQDITVSPVTVFNHWTSDTSASWNSSNWSRGHVPRAGEDVFIDRTSAAADPVVQIGSGVIAQAKSIQLSSNDSLQITGTGTLNLGSGGLGVSSGSTLHLDGGQLSTESDLEVYGVFGWSGGTLQALTPSRGVNIYGGGLLSVSTAAGVTLGAGTSLALYGDMFWDAGPIRLDGDMLIHSGGKFDASLGSDPDTLSGSGTLAILSGGTLAVTGGEALTVDMRLENTGRMNLSHSAARVNFLQGADHTGGSFSLAAGSSVSFGGSDQTHDLTLATVAGDGRVEVVGSGTTKVLAGTGYGVASTAVQSGELVLDGAAIAQASVLGGTLTLDQTGTALTSVGNLTLSSGTLAVLADAAIGNSPFSGGTLDIASGATLSATGSLSLSGSVAGVGGGVLHNSGTLTGAGTLGVGSGMFKNTGTVAPGGASVATITIAGSADLTGGRVEIGLQNTASYDKFAVVGDLVAGGSLVLSDLSGGTLASGNAFQPISFGGMQSGAAISLDSSAISYLSFTTTQAAASNSAYTITAGAASSIFWDGGGGDGLWSNKFNWSTDLLPVAGQNVTISPAGSVGVTIASGTNISGLFGLNLDATDALFVTGGSLGLPGTNLSLNGAVNLQSGSIVGNVLGGSFNGAFNWSGGTLAGSGTYTAANLSMTGSGARTLAMAAGGTLNASNPTFTNAISGGSLSLMSGTFGAGLNMVVGAGSTVSFDGGQLTTSFFRNNGQTQINTGSVSLPVHSSQTGAFVIANGANLEFSKDTTLSTSASVTGGAWSIASGKTVTAQGSINRGAGGVTFVNGKLALTDLSPLGSGLETDQLIMLSGGSISSAGAGTLKVNQSWNDGAIGTGAITGFGSATISQASGNLDFNQALAVSGVMKLNANAGSIDSATAGVTLSAGTLVASAGSLVDLMLQASTVSAGSAGGDVYLNMAGSTLIGSLSTAAGHVASITSSGGLGQIGSINTAGSVVLELGTNSVAWLSGSNVFGQGVHLTSANLAQLISSPGAALAVSGQASEVQLGGGAVQLGTSSGTLDVSGPLTVVASGNISQGAALNVSGLASLSSSAGSIVLPTLSTYGGGIAFSASGNAHFNVNSAVAIRGNTAGNLTLQAAGDVTQSAGSLSVGGNATITALGSNVALTQSNNDFGGLLVNAGQLTVVDINNLNLGGSIAGDADVSFAGDLSNGTLGSFAAANLLINSAGTGDISFAANVPGTSTFAGAGYNNITYSNASAGSYDPINAMGAVTLNQTGALVSPSVVASSAQLNATGPISQSGPLNVYGLGFSAPGQGVTLVDSSNSFTNVSGAAAAISLVSIQVIDPSLNASGVVSFSGPGINQSASNAIISAGFSANVTGGLALPGANKLGSITASAGGDIDIRDVGTALALGSVLAVNSVNLEATGNVSHASGTVQGASVQLEGNALGSAVAPVQVSAPMVSARALSADAYLANDQASSLMGLSAAGTASYSSAAAVDVRGDVAAQQVQLSSGGQLRIGNSLAPVAVTGSSFIALQGADIDLEGGSVAGASARVISGGGITVNASGHFVIQGGSQASAFAELFATGPVTVSALSTSVLGGAGDNAYAKLDPALNSLLTINSGTVDVRGGSGRGAYGVIYSQGNIVINANSLSLLEGTGVDADAVVISQFGTISVPGNCNGCLQLSADPMNDGGRSRGVFQGGQSAQVANPVLVSTPLSQIDAVIEDLVSPPDNPEDLEKERQRQGDAPTDALTCS